MKKNKWALIQAAVLHLEKQFWRLAWWLLTPLESVWVDNTMPAGFDIKLRQAKSEQAAETPAALSQRTAAKPKGSQQKADDKSNHQHVKS